MLNIEYVLSIAYRIYFYKTGGGSLEKFTPRKPEKEVISLRLAISTLEEIDEKAAEIGISRNELINQMIQYALLNMEHREN